MFAVEETFTCRLDPATGTISVVFAGPIAEVDLVRAQRAVLSSPDFAPSFNCLIDLSSVTTVRVASQIVHEIAGQIQFRCNRKCAFVAPQDITFGLARVFELSAACMPDRVEVFRDRREAEAWLSG